LKVKKGQKKNLEMKNKEKNEDLFTTSVSREKKTADF